jgi:fructose-bisphosphate aldolase class II
MAIVNGRTMLRAARTLGFAIPAFNVFNLEMMQAVLNGAEAENAPVVIQVSPRTIAYAGLAPIASLANLLAGSIRIPVALHLDHGPDYVSCMAALDVGFSSIMFDGAALSEDKNITETRRVVALAHASDASVEAELGEIGHASRGDTGASRTDPDEAARFVQATGVDALAVAIGTVHGMTEAGAILDILLIERLRERVDAALVMHGSSGVDDDTLVRAIQAGIAKVNLSTALQKAFMTALRESASQPGHETDARTVLGDARDAVEAAVRRQIQVTGASDKASEVRAA